jgi:hypothetical protein
MKITNSAEYRKLSEEITSEKLSHFRREGADEFADYLETQRQRSQVHSHIEQATGLQFEVVRSGIDANVAAFVETANDNNYITEAVLDDRTLALHAAKHEAEHRSNKVFSISLNQLGEDETAILTATLGIEKLDDLELIEGFNELSTFRKHGANENSGYAGKEVPLAEKIEKLVQEKLHFSILEIFRSGNKEKFIITLQRLAVFLQLQKTLAGFTNEPAKAA